MSIRSQEQVALLTDYDSSTDYSGAYHTLYANICFNWEKEQKYQHSLLITTPSAYASQSSVAANVAIAAARSAIPTILVDANMHAPELGQRFGLPEVEGLSELLRNDTITAQHIEQHLSETFIPGLRLLSAGRAVDASSPLLAGHFQAVLQAICLYLKETETRSGIAIFNSPPVLTGPDASVIAGHVEQTLLSIAKNRTTRKQAKQAQEQLQRAHANLVGIVMLDI